jgi:Skp family chaperone for outer membrane proteins
MRIILAVALLITATTLLSAQERREVREEVLCQTVQNDLQHATHYTRLKGKERERVDNALRSLSEFDQKFSRGDFDKGKLDQAIEDLKNVVEHNPLSAEDRSILNEDLARLRDFRAHRGA